MQHVISTSKLLSLFAKNSSNITQMNKSAPYLPTTWALGGKIEKSVDLPITAVIMLLFMISAAWHMTIFQLNRRRGHKFLFNAVLFGMFDNGKFRASH
jgi:hypothetical protein